MSDTVCLYCLNHHNLLVVENECGVFFKCDKFDAFVCLI